jgi:hypothetical protein
MYRCPGSPGDGMAVDYNSSDLDISECIDAIRWENLTFDIALIDPFHEYGTSWRDLEEGFKLIGLAARSWCMIVFLRAASW